VSAGAKRDKTRDTAPTFEDPNVAAFAERFMAGDIPVRDNRGRRYRFDGKRDAVAPSTGRRYRSQKNHHNSGVTARKGRTPL
jgi:hypothetical protein